MPRVLVLYHYFHPDDVVSAQLYTDLCLGLQERGWDVMVSPCDQGFLERATALPLRESWQGIKIRRVPRPPFRQSSTHGRILNAIWMLVAWSLGSLFHRPDALIIGTDPIFSVLVAIPWRVLHPRMRILHWCFDLYPEAAIAAGLVSERGLFMKLLRPLLRWAYRCCDVIGHLGVCMGRRLAHHAPRIHLVELPPWALVEPPAPLAADPAERQHLFGDARLTLLYSGTFGKVHSGAALITLARSLRGQGIAFAFSARGNRFDKLKAKVDDEDTNISFIDFVPREQLELRLGAADIHMVSLGSHYTGTVVPSKFQAALAAGRPVLFAGDPESSVGRWIREHGLGWCLTKDNTEAIARDLLQLQADPARLRALQNRCHETYQRLFSKARGLQTMHELLHPPCLPRPT